MSAMKGLIETIKFCEPYCVAQVLIGLNNKNPDLDIRANPERSERERSMSQLTSTLLAPQLKKGVKLLSPLAL